MSTRVNAKEKGKLKAYLKGVRAELRKVNWPNKKELGNHTGIVILISIIVALLVWALDLIIHQVLSYVI